MHGAWVAATNTNLNAVPGLSSYQYTVLFVNALKSLQGFLLCYTVDLLKYLSLIFMDSKLFELNIIYLHMFNVALI